MLAAASLIGGYLMMTTFSSSASRISGEVWNTVISEKSPAFRVEMPGTPRHVVSKISITTPQTITLPTATISGDDAQGNTYVLNLISLPPGFQHFSKEVLLRIPLNPLLSTPDSVLVSFEIAEDSAHFEISKTDGGKSFRGLVQIKDNFLVLQAITYAGSFPEKMAEKFFHSLIF